MDGQRCLLELPPDCLSVAAAAGHAKRSLGAAWADVCRQHDIIRFDGKRLADLRGVIGQAYAEPAKKKRLFLSAKGWESGGSVPDDSSLLAFSTNWHSDASSPAADELPVCLLRCGALQLQAFTWRSRRKILKDAEQAIPGSHFCAQLLSAPGPGPLELCVKTLTGKSVAVCLPSSGTVAGVKQAIKDQEGIPVSYQIIIFESTKLEDNATLASYGVSTGATLHLVITHLGASMSAYSSGRAGCFGEAGMEGDEEQVAAIAAAGRTPLEVVLPDGSSVLLDCHDYLSPAMILAALQRRLAASQAEAAVLAARVDQLQDVAALRRLLRQAQAALRERQA
ncbi:ubiquitin domain containing [Chlorella sorokiniana]|uniref:Ubiquitin domain containing n=1 Tax=Chlorella sorokiniana TaxID=3076 RepID=A0A2P6TYZ6_CHLSO|nr:ubiquitin domain containing [Chlorella sorokiniana]|eukprot:PRW59292.1 ubiquitin domain containing [Chlorella sorokiniana]